MVQELCEQGSLAHAIHSNKLAFPTHSHTPRTMRTPRHSHSRPSALGMAHTAVATPPHTPVHSHGGAWPMRNGTCDGGGGASAYAPDLLAVLHTAKEIACAVAYLHDMGVVHG